MLPWLSHLSVSFGPESRLRHRCSSQYLRISPLHWEFRFPLPYSSPAVSKAMTWLSRAISPLTYKTTYMPFTPNKSGQRLPPLYYRGCWHRVSRGLFYLYCQTARLFTCSLHLGLKKFTIRRPSSFTRCRSIRLSPIVEYSKLLPPVGVWAVSQSQCGRSPSQAG